MNLSFDTKSRWPTASLLLYYYQSKKSIFRSKIKKPETVVCFATLHEAGIYVFEFCTDVILLKVVTRIESSVWVRPSGRHSVFQFIFGRSVCHNFLKEGREVSLPCSLFYLFILFEASFALCLIILCKRKGNSSDILLPFQFNSVCHKRSAT